MYDLNVYDDKFYDNFGWEAEKIAAWFLPLLHSVIPFESFADVGCGEGHYLAYLEQEMGIPQSELFGLEGSLAAFRRRKSEKVFNWDLRRPMHGSISRYDVVMSLEVAEHIESEYSRVFVDTVCSLSDTVVMTAAPPGQGGLCHVNEQPKQWWDQVFAANKYFRDEPTEQSLRSGILAATKEGKYATPWLLPNIMVLRSNI